MIEDPNSIGFIHDLSSLDKLRQHATNGDLQKQEDVLKAAAKQFESIFTAMMFKSMRDANDAFRSDLSSSETQNFYQQMQDEQLASELSANGSLGLADLIVAQLNINNKKAANQDKLEHTFTQTARTKVNSTDLVNKQDLLVNKVMSIPITQLANNKEQANDDFKLNFSSPENFVRSLKPYAKRAAAALRIDPNVLLAQAALETGWGQKIVQNNQVMSNNLFNIKADPSWQGEKLAAQTLEYHQNVPAIEQSSFRVYPNVVNSFDDYVHFLNNNQRYAAALNKKGGSEQFIRDIHKAGYATDPKYADKVLQIKNQIESM